MSSESENQAAPAIPHSPSTRHRVEYKSMLGVLEMRVSTALLLLKQVKVEKGSADVMAAVIGILKGDS